LVARLLLVTIMCRASSETRIVRPIIRCTSALASRPDPTRKADPSATLRKRLRTCTRLSGSISPACVAPKTPTSTGTLMVLAAWNHSSPR
jgi:hypothetical protein